MSDKYFRDQYDISESKQSVNTSSLADEFLASSTFKKSSVNDNFMSPNSIESEERKNDAIERIAQYPL